MLTSTVTTDSIGNFSITGKYTCPASDPLVYLVSTGGNPGLGGSVNNSGIALMSLLGSCSSLTPNTYVVINELTTVVSVGALASFMTDYAHVGSASTSLSSVSESFGGADLPIFSTGQFDSSSLVQIPVTTYDTLADILAACVNSSGSGAPCSTLYANTGGSSDTIGAALYMSRFPAKNTAALYGLVSATPPFQPFFTSVPTDLTATIGYPVPDFVRSFTLDSTGHIWIYFGGYSYDFATDTSTDKVGYIQVYDNNFNPLFQVSMGTGGLYYPVYLSPDASGHVFTVNSNNTISEFASNGTAISPAGGWSNGLTNPFSPSGPGNYYQFNPASSPIQVDALGNIWGSFAPGGGLCYYEMNSHGDIITPAITSTTGNFCTTTLNPDIFAGGGVTDGSGNAWATAIGTIAQVNAFGNLSATAPISTGCFYPAGYASPGNFQSFESATNTLLFDHVHQQLWGISGTGAGAITNTGNAIFCDYGAAVLPVIPETVSSASAVGSPFSGNTLRISTKVLDGAGNLWFTTTGLSESGVVASSSGSTILTYSGTASFSLYLNEISPSGVLLSPYNAATHTYGYQPAGFAPNATAVAANAPISDLHNAGTFTSALLGIDNLGNIWAIDSTAKRILKITGMATANTVNY